MRHPPTPALPRKGGGRNQRSRDTISEIDTMTTMHDIYDPPPAPIPWAPPEPEPLNWTAGDLTVLASFSVLVVAASALAWQIDSTMAFLILLGGALVIVESWFTALGFLHRRPMTGL